MAGREIQSQIKQQGATNRARDLSNSQSRIKSDQGLPLGDVGAAKVVITDAVTDGLDTMCNGDIMSGNLTGMTFENVRCDGTVANGDTTTMIMTTDGYRIQALATGSASGGGTTQNITNINNNFFLVD